MSAMTPDDFAFYFPNVRRVFQNLFNPSVCVLRSLRAARIGGKLTFKKGSVSKGKLPNGSRVGVGDV